MGDVGQEAKAKERAKTPPLPWAKFGPRFEKVLVAPLIKVKRKDFESWSLVIQVAKKSMNASSTHF